MNLQDPNKNKLFVHLEIVFMARFMKLLYIYILYILLYLFLYFNVLLRHFMFHAATNKNNVFYFAKVLIKCKIMT